MTTTIASFSSATPPPEAAGSVLLRGVSWRGYRTLLDEIGDGAAHLTYDDGLLEIEAPSKRHEELKKLSAALVEIALDVADLDYQPLGSTTWNREESLKGIEADECYYVQSIVVQGVTASAIESHLKLLEPIGTWVHSAVVRHFRASLADGSGRV